ncbi:MAG TPA: enolase C-terminal domain-like protein [Geminicoccaceae bacterium]|nr:enolase C-terminal domain-like protein [Geminicoccaceae bacterium]
MARRRLLRAATAAGLAFGAPPASAAVLGNPRRVPKLRIGQVLLQRAPGRRLTPVAPNAYAPYRGYGATDPVLRVRTAQGLEGIGCCWGPPEALGPLLGLDPFDLFEWDGDAVRGPAAAHAALLDRLAGADVALFDLLGRAIGRPVADLLGPRARESVAVYDSSLYMEDLLASRQREGLAYLRGLPPEDPTEMVARKAAWLLDRPGGVRTFKIKVGRAKWMESFDAALARDVAVVAAVRRAVGDGAALLVDGNNGYRPRPLAAAEFGLATAGEDVLAMEEMFDEELTAEAREVKRRLRAAGVATKLADGETHPGGIPAGLLAERFTGAGGSVEPLYDIDQPDMNTAGYTRLMAVARACAGYGITVAPHNFGSKLGFYAQVHAGLATPNWEFSEVDDSAFPALRPDGFRLERGRAWLTGTPGLGVTLDETHLDAPLLDLRA